jgi:hypothetical protein
MVMIINGCAGQPKELRFLDVSIGWRWLDARIELGEVKLQRDLGQKFRLKDVKVVASGQNRARNFARLIGKLWDLQITEELPGAGSIAIVEDGGDLRVEFHAEPSSEPIGPILHIKYFEAI